MNRYQFSHFCFAVISHGLAPGSELHQADPPGHWNRSWCLGSGSAFLQFVLNLSQLRVSIYTDHRDTSKSTQLTLASSSDVTLMIGREISTHLAFQRAHKHTCTCNYKYVYIYRNRILNTIFLTDNTVLQDLQEENLNFTRVFLAFLAFIKKKNLSYEYASQMECTHPF